jgi:pyruvate dehydrogenase E2 component (dihydrolipoamide acetyltransferase)
MADITMPQLGETVTEGTVTKWFKSVGDEVSEDETLFEVSTDKVDSEVPSPASGYLAEILVEEGDTVDVGTKLAVISDSPPGDGESAAPAKEEAEAEEEEPEPEGEPEPAAEEEAEEEEAEEEAAEAPTETEGEAEVAPEEMEETAEDGDGDDGAKREEAKPRADGKGAGKAPAPSRPKAGAPSGGGEGKLLSPVVRRLISEHGLDADQIEGTGQGGRITRNDVLALVEGGGAAKAAPAGKEKAPAKKAAPAKKEEAPAAARPAPAPAAKAGERDETVPFTNIRKRTAEHMVRSKATSAHTLVSVEVDFENVDRVRLAAREEFKAREGTSLTYLPFVSRAVIDAIEEFPHMNASVGDNELIVHNYVNLGIAVDLNFEGLVAPVIKDADGKRMRAIAREIADLAARARAKKLGPDEISGGTFTITNPGPFGTLMTGPIINQPQVAILSTDGVKKRPVVVEAADGSDAIVIHPVGILALAFDHRAVDGAYASAFVVKVKEILETRDWVAEL